MAAFLPPFMAAMSLNDLAAPPGSYGGPSGMSDDLKLDIYFRRQHGILPSDTTAPRLVFGAAKAKELDSGLVELETPNSPSLPIAGPVAQSPASLISAFSSTPALASSEVDPTTSTAATTSPARSVASVCSVDLAAAHNNAELRRRLEEFQSAQRFFPGDGILFVGNLPAVYTDLQLNEEVVNLFSCIGPAYVHVDRTYSREYVKPYALVQLTSFEAAQAAVDFCEYVKPRIGGRPIRVERSRATRAFRIMRHDGSPISTASLSHTFDVYGELESMCRMTMPEFRDVDPFTPYLPTMHVVQLEFVSYGSYLDAKKAVELGEGLAAQFELLRRRY